MINVIDMQYTLALKWIKMIYTNQHALYACIPMNYYEKLGENFLALKSNIGSKYFKGFEIRKTKTTRPTTLIFVS